MKFSGQAIANYELSWPWKAAIVIGILAMAWLVVKGVAWATRDDDWKGRADKP